MSDKLNEIRGQVQSFLNKKASTHPTDPTAVTTSAPVDPEGTSAKTVGLPEGKNGPTEVNVPVNETSAGTPPAPFARSGQVAEDGVDKQANLRKISARLRSTVAEFNKKAGQASNSGDNSLAGGSATAQVAASLEEASPLLKAAHQLLSSDEGREQAVAILRRNMAKEAAETLVKQASAEYEQVQQYTSAEEQLHALQVHALHEREALYKEARANSDDPEKFDLSWEIHHRGFENFLEKHAHLVGGNLDKQAAAKLSDNKIQELMSNREILETDYANGVLLGKKAADLLNKGASAADLGGMMVPQGGGIDPMVIELVIAQLLEQGVITEEEAPLLYEELMMELMGGADAGIVEPMQKAAALADKLLARG